MGRNIVFGKALRPATLPLGTAEAPGTESKAFREWKRLRMQARTADEFNQLARLCQAEVELYDKKAAACEAELKAHYACFSTRLAPKDRRRDVAEDRRIEIGRSAEVGVLRERNLGARETSARERRRGASSFQSRPGSARSTRAAQRVARRNTVRRRQRWYASFTGFSKTRALRSTKPPYATSVARLPRRLRSKMTG